MTTNRALTIPPAALRLAGYSALILFFELAFIRYTSAYVRVFGFYLNFVLIATFLGMGVGLLRAESTKALKWIGPPTAIGLLGAVAVFSVSNIALPDDKNEYVWGIFMDNRVAHQTTLLTVVVVLFAVCALFFVPLGALLGAQFKKLPPLEAYAADIVGSLVGIAVFGLLSAVREPPVVWLVIGLVGWAALSLDDVRFAGALATVTAVAIWLTQWTAVKPEYWSPYYRVNVRPHEAGAMINVNGSLHQIMLRLDSSMQARNKYVGAVRPAYMRPYAYAPRLDTVLVVGAGSGNDLSLLLQRGVKYIDAVEIDPTIADIGAMAHPLRPYSDARVHLHIDDARAFLRKTSQQYDAIIFGTLDSQTLLSGMSSVRLDNYVYTVESFQSARARLKPDGTLIVYHMSANKFISGKLYHMLTEVFTTPPGVFCEYDFLFNYTFIVGHGASSVPPMADSVATSMREPGSLPHDDWPYLYLRTRTIPMHYIVALGAVLLISLVFLGVGGGAVLARGWDASMFFMGVGFLLVETKSVTEMSLLFGSTWTVNLLVFASILIMVLIANVVVQRRPPRRTAPLFGGLFATLLIAYLLPASALLWLGTVGQWIAGGLMVAAPVFFASLIFSTLLGRRSDAARALACNLLGAIVGGVLEYSSMAVGIKALYIIAAVTYAVAAMFARREDGALASQG